MKWISVKDSLPLNKIPIRVLINNEEHVAYWEEDTDCYRVGCSERCYYCGGYTNICFVANKHHKLITHWMPLPKPPGQK
jgi:hypothetical protein